VPNVYECYRVIPKIMKFSITKVLLRSPLQVNQNHLHMRSCTGNEVIRFLGSALSAATCIFSNVVAEDHFRRRWQLIWWHVFWRYKEQCFQHNVCVLDFLSPLLGIVFGVLILTISLDMLFYVLPNGLHA
jgi:membrane protein insertase Oxa1/YidC/SpoIIIJ